MAVHKKSPEAPSRLPMHVPTVYADAVTDALYGVFTTKLVFSVESGVREGDFVPVQTVTIPTSALVHAVGKILRDLAEVGIADETDARLKEHMKLIRSLHIAAKADGST